MAKNKIVRVHDIYGKEKNVNAEELKFRPSIYGIVFDRDKVLLSKQWDGYDLPGGGAELGETVEETLKREIWEETGIEVEMVMPVYCGTSFFWPNVSPKHQNEVWNCPLMYFLCRKVGGELSDANFDAEEQEYASMAEWVDLDKVDQLKFYNSIDSSKVIQQAFKLTKNWL